MSREWKPGAVAMVETKAGGPCISVRTSGDVWSCEHGKTVDDNVIDVHPLVVIDPETILPGWGGSLVSSLLEASAQIVAESAAPREVNETTLLLNLAHAFDVVLDPDRAVAPTDPKARVTDRRDNIWRLLADGEWVCVDGPDHGEYLTWAELVGRGPLRVES